MKSPHHSSPIDLTPYQASGFPGDLDAAIANVGVRGVAQASYAIGCLTQETAFFCHKNDVSR